MLSWTAPGPMVDLRMLPGATMGLRVAVDGGQVVGYCGYPSGTLRAFSWTVDGGMVDLGRSVQYIAWPSPSIGARWWAST